MEFWKGQQLPVQIRPLDWSLSTAPGRGTLPDGLLNSGSLAIFLPFDSPNLESQELKNMVGKWVMSTASSESGLL